MVHKLQFRDGLAEPRPWLRSEVRRMQRALIEAGHSLDADGFFGRGTEKIVKVFQSAHGLSPDGIVGANTWNALKPFLDAVFGARNTLIARVLPQFTGDLDWIHDLEGHRGRPYWPGGNSGVTLDPGIDLGHVDRGLFQDLYGNLLSHQQLIAAQKVFGIRGEKAKSALAADPVLQGIRISREQADEIMPFASKPYWRNISARFTSLSDDKTLPAATTALLSLAYNRGHGNPALESLRPHLEQNDWHALADEIGKMQQDHSLKGIRQRRRWEAELIRSELG